ncbi:DUF2752 domain-containing protein [Janibacter sp. GXQ6167]|uniref:DUF2752 domain-containing protein n=1 Tax=Janibacter sp. GXQ6167 TaxID=3240791 RepID=UPI003526AEB5
MTAPNAQTPATTGAQRVHVPGGSLGMRATTFVLAGLSLAALVAAFMWPLNTVDNGPGWCVFRAATGLPCPGCGLTRSWVHLANGDVGTAFAYNAFGPIMMLLAAGIVGYVVVALVRRRPPENLLNLLASRAMVIGLGAWIGYSVVRIVSLSLGYDTFAIVVG